MVLSQLSEFVDSVPTSLESNSPTQWLEDCVAGGIGCLVIVDKSGVPTQVLHLQTRPTPENSLKSLREPTIKAQSFVLVGENGELTMRLLLVKDPEMKLVFIDQPLSEVAQQVAAYPASSWVVVDGEGRYQGLVNASRLLAIALSQSLSAVVDGGLSEAAAITERRVSSSNTALLTYLGHELKTPLTSLLGLSSLLKAGSLGELTPRQNRYMSLIQQHCRRLAAWVNTLIDLGRVDSGALKIIPQAIDLPSLWREAYRQAALRVGKEDSVPPPVPQPFGYRMAPLSLIADPARLQQMLSCLMQTALAIQSTALPENGEFPLFVESWDEYIAFMVELQDDSLSLSQLSHTVFTPSSTPLPTPMTPLAAEMGHWLEWLLVRKLAQLHQGELVLTSHPQKGICPVLILPSTQAQMAARESRLLLLVAPLQATLIHALEHQVTQLNYRLLTTPHIRGAIETATHISVAAILVWVDSAQCVANIKALKASLPSSDSLVVALVPPKWSSLLGESAADRELLWPAGSLGSVLLKPPAAAPPPNRLTILYLKGHHAKGGSPGQNLSRESRFPNIFHDFGCRVLEVDDVEQAELLCRVWKPDVAILDPAIADPDASLQSISQSSQLAALPIITLTLRATQAAHQISNLRVFPCLIGDTAWETPEASDRMTTWLIRVLQTAATRK